MIHLAAAWVPVFLPEVWRQMDTLGVSLRYYLKFTSETSGSLGFRILPSVLQAGDLSGIMPMEFPLLNLLFAPFWIAGPAAGKVMIYLGLSCLVYGIAYALFRAGRGIYRYGFLLFPSVSYATDYYAKFMPDPLSFLLVLAGVVLPFSRLPANSKWVRLSPLWITLGILMKPTAAAGLAFFFVIRKMEKKEIKAFLKLVWFPLFTAGLYYTWGLNLLRSEQDGASLFATQVKNPVTALLEILPRGGDLYRHFAERPFFFGALPFIVIAIFISFRRFQKISLILVVQFWLIVALDGEHSFTHDYYFVALAPTCCALYALALLRHRAHWLGLILFLGILVRPLELSIKDAVRIAGGSRDTRYAECEDLKARHPEFPWHQGTSFRSNAEAYPSLGICFGEKEGSTQANFGFFYRQEGGLPEGCVAVDQTPVFILARCQKVSSVGAPKSVN